MLREHILTGFTEAPDAFLRHLEPPMSPEDLAWKSYGGPTCWRPMDPDSYAELCSTQRAESACGGPKMLESVSHYRQRLIEKGISGVVSSRWRWYKKRFQMDNWFVGRLIELTGNRIQVDGITLSVDNALIDTTHKSSIYFGFYEMGERELTKRYIDRNLPTVEIGGSIGGVACITNKLLHNPSAHVVLECNPSILPTLKCNRELNDCKFSIEPCALSYGGDTASFTIVRTGWMVSGLHAEKIGEPVTDRITVAATTLAAILGKYGFDTINLISDSEGVEVEMVEQEADLLRRRVKWLVFETHAQQRGADAIARTLSRLRDLGFETKEQDRHTGTVFAMVNRSLA